MCITIITPQATLTATVVYLSFSPLSLTSLQNLRITHATSFFASCPSLSLPPTLAPLPSFVRPLPHTTVHLHFHNAFLSLLLFIPLFICHFICHFISLLHTILTLSAFSYFVLACFFHALQTSVVLLYLRHLSFLSRPPRHSRSVFISTVLSFRLVICPRPHPHTVRLVCSLFLSTESPTS